MILLPFLLLFLVDGCAGSRAVLNLLAMGYRAHHTGHVADAEYNVLMHELKHGRIDKHLVVMAKSYEKLANLPISLVDLVAKAASLDASKIEVPILDKPIMQHVAILEHLNKLLVPTATYDPMYVEYLSKILLEVTARIGHILAPTDTNFEKLLQIVVRVEQIHLRLLKGRELSTAQMSLKLHRGGMETNVSEFERGMQMSLNQPFSFQRNAVALSKIPVTTSQLPIDSLFMMEKLSIQRAIKMANQTNARIRQSKTPNQYLSTVAQILKNPTVDKNNLLRVLGLHFYQQNCITPLYRYFASIDHVHLFVSTLTALGVKDAVGYVEIGERMSSVQMTITWNEVQWADNLKTSPLAIIPMNLFDNLFKLMRDKKDGSSILDLRLKAHLISCEIASCLIKSGKAKEADNAGIESPLLRLFDYKPLLRSMNALAKSSKSIHSRLFVSDTLSLSINILHVGMLASSSYPTPALKEEGNAASQPISQHFLKLAFLLAHCFVMFKGLEVVHWKMRSLMAAQVAVGNRYGADMRMAELLTLNFF